MYAFVLGEETVFLVEELLELTPQLGEIGRRDCHGRDGVLEVFV